MTTKTLDELPLAQRNLHIYSSSKGTSAKPVKWLRFTSGTIDTFIMGLVAIMFYFLNGGGAAAGDTEMKALEAILYTLPFGFAYGVFLESSRLQGTIGKIVTGTIVTDENGERISFARSVVRNIGKIISSFVPFYIGYSMVLFSTNRQCVHDLFSGTLVYRKGRGPLKTASVFD